MELFKLFGRIAVNCDEANQNIDETTDKAEQSESRMSGAFKKIGLAVAGAFAVDKIINFGKEIVNVAQTAAAEQSAFDQIMGGYAKSATEKMQGVADATGMVDTRLTPYMTSMTAKFKGLGYDIEDATTLASDGLTLAADASAFWDKSLDESMSHLNSFINGSYEGGEAIGLFANDTQMASYAVSQGIVSQTKDWASLDEATKQATRLEYAQNMMELSGATGQAAKESDQYANVQANLAEKTRQFKAQIGEPLLQNLVIPAMEKLSGVVDVLSVKFQDASKWVSEHKGILIVIASAIAVVTGAIALQSAAQGIKAAMNATETTSLAGLIAAKLADAAATMAALAPYLLIAAAIAAVIAIIILLVKNWDKVKEVAQKVWEKIKEIWGKVADWFRTNIVDPIVNLFKGLWDSIVEIWDGIKNAIHVALLFIVELIKAWFNLVTLPFRFIWENCKEYVFAAFEWIKEKISLAIEFIKNLVLKGFELVQKYIIDPINKAKEKVVDLFEKLKAAIDSKISALREKVSNVFNSIKNKIEEAIQKAKDKVSSTIDTMRSSIDSKISALRDKVSSVFNSIRDKMTAPINKARDVIKSGIDKIKGFFDSLKLKFPNIKLPHFSIKGEFSLDPPSVPHLAIDWYAKAMDNGMIMNKPTIFGVNGNGQLMGGGETGSETVVGTNSLLNMIRASVQEETSGMSYYLEKLISMLAAYFPEIIEKLEQYIVLDDGTLVGKISPKIDKKLGDINGMKARGN